MLGRDELLASAGWVYDGGYGFPAVVRAWKLVDMGGVNGAFCRELELEDRQPLKPCKRSVARPLTEFMLTTVEKASGVRGRLSW